MYTPPPTVITFTVVLCEYYASSIQMLSNNNENYFTLEDFFVSDKLVSLIHIVMHIQSYLFNGKVLS